MLYETTYYQNDKGMHLDWLKVACLNCKTVETFKGNFWKLSGEWKANHKCAPRCVACGEETSPADPFCTEICRQQWIGGR